MDIKNKPQKLSAKQKNETVTNSTNKEKSIVNKSHGSLKDSKYSEADIRSERQIKLTDYLEGILPKLVFTTGFLVLSGGFIIFLYLYRIDQLTIYPNIITDPVQLVAASSILIFIYLSAIFLFYIISQFRLNDSMCECILLHILFIIILYFWQGSSDYIGSILILSVSILLMGWFFYVFLTERGHRDLIKILVIIIPMLFVGLTLMKHDFVIAYLHPLRFIETPENSSWYLLYNNAQQNNGFQEINGINELDLKRLKSRFRDKNKTTKDKRKNALYGYMAWNLGDTKLFCPSTADNTLGNLSSMDSCIIISEKNLQIMPEKYIFPDHI